MFGSISKCSRPVVGVEGGVGLVRFAHWVVLRVVRAESVLLLSGVVLVNSGCLQDVGTDAEVCHLLCFGLQR